MKNVKNVSMQLIIVKNAKKITASKVPNVSIEMLLVKMVYTKFGQQILVSNAETNAQMIHTLMKIMFAVHVKVQILFMIKTVLINAQKEHTNLLMLQVSQYV